VDPAEARLAARTGLNQSEISNIESGQANPTYKTLQTVAAALGGKIDFVLG
jgi:transcriptional regulator with XRE-family HTH domain